MSGRDKLTLRVSGERERERERERGREREEEREMGREMGEKETYRRTYTGRQIDRPTGKSLSLIFHLHLYLLSLSCRFPLSGPLHRRTSERHHDKT